MDTNTKVVISAILGALFVILIMSSSGDVDCQTSINFCTVIIALGAFILSLMVNIQNRKHLELSVKPYLNIQNKHVSNTLERTILTNNGEGLAIITKFEILQNDHLLIDKSQRPEDYSKLMKAFEIPEKTNPEDVIVEIPGAHLKPEQSINILRFDLDKISPTAKKNIKKNQSAIRIKIEYQSIYGQADSKDITID